LIISLVSIWKNQVGIGVYGNLLLDPAAVLPCPGKYAALPEIAGKLVVGKYLWLK
jgi:hypothetical protein